MRMDGDFINMLYGIFGKPSYNIIFDDIRNAFPLGSEIQRCLLLPLMFKTTLRELDIGIMQEK